MGNSVHSLFFTKRVHAQKYILFLGVMAIPHKKYLE